MASHCVYYRQHLGNLMLDNCIKFFSFKNVFCSVLSVL